MENKATEIDIFTQSTKQGIANREETEKRNELKDR